MTKREEIQLKATKKVLESKFNGILDVSPRVGKTKIILDAIKALNKDKFDTILVAAPYTDILNSWKEECINWNFNIPLLYTTNVSLSKQEVPDLLIVDECQELSPANIKWIKESGVKHIILMSGTIGEKTYKDLSVLGVSNIYTYTIDEAIQDGIVNDYEIRIQYIPLNNTHKYIEAGNKDKKWLQSEFADYTYLDKNFKKFRNLEWNCQAKDKSKWAAIKNMCATKRMNALYNYNSKYLVAKSILEKTNKPTIVYVARQEMADRLTNSYHSGNTKEHNEQVLTLFKEGKIDYVVAIGKLSMGVSFPTVSNILMVQINSNEELAVQKAMRACMTYEGKKKSTITILCYANTQDEVWVKKAIQGFNPNKIIGL